jgi:coenzyme F420 hydrogenase subunit beta
MIKQPNNVSVTVNNNLCIGCGICKVACPHNVIDIFFTKKKEYNPVINMDKCVDCGLCINTCPMYPKNLSERVNAAYNIGKDYGVYSCNSFYQGYELDHDNYTKSSSGGVLSALLCELLEKNEIDAVIHVEQLEGNNNEMFFKSSISKSSVEINKKRSSFYYPIEFSSVLKKVIQDKSLKSVAITGTPCVLSGIELLKKKNKEVNKKLKYSFALICSHNVNGHFSDCIAEYFDNSSEKKKLKFRDKKNIDNSGDFHNSILLNGVLKTESRYKTPFTKNWRNFSYALNGCFYCPDFFGVSADAGFKDAWGLGLTAQQGETAFFIKNSELQNVVNTLEDNNKIAVKKLTKKTFVNSQLPTVFNKTKYSAIRATKHRELKKHTVAKGTFIESFFIRIDFLLKRNNSKKSTAKRIRRSKNVGNMKLNLLSFLTSKIDKFLFVLSMIKQRGKTGFEVLYTAGFGYQNIGDEAQLSGNLTLWKELSPNAKVTILSPNPDYTREVHGNYDIILAARNTFWGFKGFEYGGLVNSKYFKYLFRYKLIGLKINAFFMKYFNTTFFISPESSYLLKRIKNANLLHIGGGGFLTGKTESRLYDNMGLISIANYFNTDIILSGHNIGIWQTRSHKRIAKQLSKAKYVGLRDNENSVADLKEIKQYSEEKVFALFDDALFCPGVESKILESFFNRNNLSLDKKYILINAYFIQQYKDKITEIFSDLASVLNSKINHSKYNIILLSMHSADISALSYLKGKLNVPAKIFVHNDDFPTVISLIQNAEITITMRHHPIIFSMAGTVPALSIVFDEYFLHKNIGAMKLFNQEKYVKLYDNLTRDVLESQILELLNKRDVISAEIAEYMIKYKLKKGYVIKKYLENYASHMLKQTT